MIETLREGETAKSLVSVIIPSVNGLPVLAECVQCLVDQKGLVPVEILVVDCCGEATRAVIRERFPHARVIPIEGRPSIPALRSIGIQQSTGQFIAIIEDHCLVEPGWLQAIEQAMRDGLQAVGGPVENGSTDRIIDWAVFFCEYTRFMPPLTRGIDREIPGNNSAYDRRIFELLQPELKAEVWEAFLQARMQQLGVRFFCDPGMVVLHKKEFGFIYFFGQRFHYSRSFAGMRMAEAPWWKRCVYAAATAILPPLLFFRTTRIVWQKRRHLREYVLCLPVLSTFFLSWAFGETVGALLGPGRSLERVE